MLSPMLHLGFYPVVLGPGRSPGSMHIRSPSWLVPTDSAQVAAHVPPRSRQTKPSQLVWQRSAQVPIHCPQQTPDLLPNPLVWVASTLVQVPNSVVWTYTWSWNLRRCNQWGCPWHVPWKPERQFPASAACLCLCPHLLCWTLFDGYFLPIDLVFNEKILYRKLTKCGHLEVKTFHLASLILSL